MRGAAAVWYTIAMKTPLPDLFDRDKNFAPAAQALRSRKREEFCQQVAGECWGNNTEAYCRAFGAADRDAAGASAAAAIRSAVSARRARRPRG